ncbi:MAG: hypothetical protein ACQETL_00115 [Bacteroidota bacterium]
MKALLVLPLMFFFAISNAQELTIIEQDYTKARKIAESEDKLLFIDF